MNPVLILAWVTVVIALIDGFVVSGRDSMIYLGLNFVAGILFIIAGIMQVTVQVFGYQFSAITFGMAWIALSVIEVYSVQLNTEESSDESSDTDG